ncbi:sodium:proton antiporter (plasmid) [Roseibium aggregatum]|nr:sodium:proton antiporter [Roseibium aggregatum]
MLLGTLLAVRLGIGSLPAMVTARDIALAALLAGVGFTMSLFIVTAAFHDPLLADTAKLAVLAGSALSQSLR